MNTAKNPTSSIAIGAEKATPNRTPGETQSARLGTTVAVIPGAAAAMAADVVRTSDPKVAEVNIDLSVPSSIARYLE